MGEVGELWFFPLSTVCKVFWKYLAEEREFILVAWYLHFPESRFDKNDDPYITFEAKSKFKVETH